SGGSGGSSSGGSGTPFTAVSDPSHMVQPPKEAEEKLFEDIDGFEWAETAITALYEKGIISGREPKRFCPENGITREEFVKLLVLLFKVKETDERDNTFSDCVEGEWYYPYIRTAYTVGIVNGISDTEFGVGQNITRQDAAVMIKNCMEKYEVQRNAAAEFSDMSEVSDYAKDAVRSMREYGIITGYEDNSFRPENYITRAEAAKLIFETDERIDEI
ncbi:MAG: S-layer homology domain-containing protein, partial [Clostridia bacterium]|nr:S-layer homology domain-containing protein [Clostridia bacterium]